ncbi:hypothetical protein AAFF_G00362110 [Aldrovandia affinis]|uniref:Ig-like domain-containing protein n=1 Tax=Aldrovandia affinis TaxID=143900 RepID=A0AAD7WN06_9TELE|nr:hypothetical protein AAFF_G00362110 [Aldrovandia affinis]
MISSLFSYLSEVAGNLTERSEPVKVTVKEGDHAVLPCSASASIVSDTKVDRLLVWWTHNDQDVCAFAKGKPYAACRNRTKIFRQEGRDAHFLLIINDTVFTDGGEYTCFMQKPGKIGYAIATIHLIVQGKGLWTISKA